MASTVAICNRGLSFIGLGAINALTEDSAEARACNTHYEEERLILLESFPWFWAEDRAVLALFTTNDRDDEWIYKYRRPIGVLTLRWVQDTGVLRSNRDGHKAPSAPYDMTQDAIYTDVEDACAEWTKDDLDPNNYPPTFREALSWAVAKTVAVAITETVDRASFAQTGYVAAKERAEMLDLAERPQEAVVMADWLRARGYSPAGSASHLHEHFAARGS